MSKHILRRIEIKPNNKMKQYIDDCMWYSMYQYNLMLTEKERRFANHMSSYETSLFNVYSDLSKQKELWEYKYPNFLRNSARLRLAKAYDFYFQKKKRKPKLKETPQSFTIPKDKFIKGGMFKFTDKTMWFIFQCGSYCPVDKNKRFIKMTEMINPEWFKRLKEVTITKDVDRYFATFCIEIDDRIYPGKKDNIIGIDLGLKTFAVCSDGMDYDYNTEELNRLTKKADFYKSQMSRRYKKGRAKQSNNYEKAKKKYALINRKIRNIREDFLNKLSHKIAYNYDVVVIERLDIKELASKHRRMSHKFSRKMFNSCFGTFCSKVSAMCGTMNTICELIKPSILAATQTCSNCNNRLKHENKLTLKDRMYVCPKCGMKLDRDINAAYNLYNYGKSLLSKNITKKTKRTKK